MAGSLVVPYWPLLLLLSLPPTLTYTLANRCVAGSIPFHENLRYIYATRNLLVAVTTWLYSSYTLHAQILDTFKSFIKCQPQLAHILHTYTWQSPHLHVVQVCANITTLFFNRQKKCIHTRTYIWCNLVCTGNGVPEDSTTHTLKMLN